MEDAYLSDDDLDLALARAVERGGVGADPLLARLAPLRAGPRLAEPRVAALWAAIEAQTLPVPARPLGRADRAPAAPGSRRRLRWATAGAFASLALLAAVAVLTLRPAREGLDVAVASGAAPQTVRLADGSAITVRAGSHLTQTTDEAGLVRFDLDGEARFDVTHNPQRRFEVATPGGMVSVLGTAVHRCRRCRLDDGDARTRTRRSDLGCRRAPHARPRRSDDGQRAWPLRRPSG